jgi:hypothetical protein
MKLDSERVERLAIDRALGALDEDVDALLAAYLELEPDAARVAAGVDGTARLARESIGSIGGVDQRDTSPLPPFPADRLRKAGHGGSRAMRLAGIVAALAACVVAGSLLGATLARRASVAPGGAPVVRQEPPPANDGQLVRAAPAGRLFGAPAREASAGSGLWSARRLIARADSRQRASASNAPTLRWTSPTKLQRNEEQP